MIPDPLGHRRAARRNAIACSLLVVLCVAAMARTAPGSLPWYVFAFWGGLVLSFVPTWTWRWLKPFEDWESFFLKISGGVERADPPQRWWR